MHISAIIFPRLQTGSVTLKWIGPITRVAFSTPIVYWLFVLCEAQFGQHNGCLKFWAYVADHKPLVACGGLVWSLMPTVTDGSLRQG